MDGQRPLLTRIRAQLALFDDAALEALANRGLLRRAYKDLDTTAVTVIGETGDTLQLAVGDATVTLPDAPQRASCTCPAGGACRHILVAILAMRSGGRDAVAPEPGITDSPSAGSPASALPEVLALDDATLQKWAGKPLFRKALRRLANGLEVVIEGGAPLTIAIPALQITCRWFPGAGFDGMLCGCHAAGPCEHRVLAILGVQARHGRAIVAEAAAMLEAASGAPRTRAEVLAAVGGMLHELVIHGFSCAADATVERMQTLAVSAHGVDLPRLERLLETLAEETRLLLARSAAADTHNLLGAAAQAAALRLALAARPTARLVGEHRSRYDDIGTLELAGMGARRWRTRSGYVGLTVYFWDAVSHAWATWSDARPAEQAEQFDPARRYLADGPWPGCACPGEAARSRLRLMPAWRNAIGRLSGRAATQALIIGDAGWPAGLPISTDWRALTDRALTAFGDGFRDGDERGALVLLQPARWEDASFDDVRQELVRPVFDADDRGVCLVLPYTAEYQGAIATLEGWRPTPGTRLLGLLRLRAGAITVEPFTLYAGTTRINLTLDAPRCPPQTAARPCSPLSGDDAGDDRGHSAVSRLLAALAAELEILAESGLLAARRLDTLRADAARLHALGLTACAEALGALLTALDAARGSADADPALPAAALLRAYYLLRWTMTLDALLSAAAAWR